MRQAARNEKGRSRAPFSFFRHERPGGRVPLSGVGRVRLSRIPPGHDQLEIPTPDFARPLVDEFALPDQRTAADRDGIQVASGPAANVGDGCLEVARRFHFAEQGDSARPFELRPAVPRDRRTVRGRFWLAANDPGIEAPKPDEDRSAGAVDVLPHRARRIDGTCTASEGAAERTLSAASVRRGRVETTPTGQAARSNVGHGRAWRGPSAPTTKDHEETEHNRGDEDFRVGGWNGRVVVRRFHLRLPSVRGPFTSHVTS